MKRLVVLAVVAAVTLSSFLIPTSGASGSGPIRLRFVAPDGEPLENASVGVFLHPFGHGLTYVAPRLLLVKADENGRVDFGLTDIKLAVAEAAKSHDAWINVEVRALDADREWMFTQPMMLPVGGSMKKNLVANADLSRSPIDPARSIESIFSPPLVTGCSDSMPNRPMCQKHIGTRKRPVKIASLHVSRAMKGSFLFGKARETDHETVTRVCYPDQCESWQAGMFVRENRARDSSNRYPSPRGPWHRVMRAVYEERRYKECSSGQSSFENCEVINEFWEPEVWTGGVNTSRPNVPGYVKYNKFYSFPLVKGQEFRTRSQSNQTYGEGLTLMFVALRSQTGYSKTTKLTWTGLAGCKSRRLYGHEKHPTRAGVIYARSRKCN